MKGNNQFVVDELKTGKLPRSVEKVYFTCPHCEHEYVAFYTDLETRKLQERMRRLHRRFADPNQDRNKLIKQETRLKKQIKRKMQELRENAKIAGG